MVVKVHIDSRHQTETQWWVNGNHVSSNTMIVGDYTRSDAIRSRPKPIILGVTGFVFSSSLWNEAVFDRRNQLGTGRVGPAGYVFNTAQETVTESDTGAIGLTKALAKTSGSRSGWGEALGEARSTADMLKNRTRQLGAFALALKRGDLNAAARALGLEKLKDAKSVREALMSKKPADAYLETMYGWRPVVDEISKAVDIYAEGFAKRGQQVRKVSGKGFQMPEGWETSRKRLPSLQSSGGFRGTVNSPLLYEANNLGLLNPIETGWNLVGKSFVFDWLIPVGTFLGALTGGAGLGHFGAWTTVQSRTVSYVGPNVNERNIPWSVNYRGARTPAFGAPSLSVLKSGAAGSFGQLVTLAALFRQRLSK